MNVRNTSQIRESIVDGGSSRIIRRLINQVLLSQSQVLASAGGESNLPDYGWYRQFESRRPNPHQFRKPK